MNTHTIQLGLGYRDPKGALHKDVTFGKRLTGRELFNIDTDPQAKNQTQYTALLMRAAITKFGALVLPVTLNALLDLGSTDRDDLTEAFNEFQGMTERQAEFISESELRLPIGYERNGIVYDRVTFGTMMTGWHEVEADKQNLTGIKRVCFLTGKQIVKLTATDGGGDLAGEVGIEVFEELDVADIYALRLAGEVWRQSFRRSGKAVQKERVESDGVAVSA